ncbi:MAG: isoprenylcysteine carboxylmethyltransferase family protein [Candidatus Bathyarchaeota archaeon]|nr:isoprenylcysteine carboxylmethyltransferase family protein [Candidatus Bathyarchaeota archaeon]MDH5779432.1 isoprenylcysteine carboxylmethyltransferase family protein [Candidatus Bathyarchaeota archaeon]
MSLIPEFELGLWNAWIFMVPSLLLMLLCLLVMTKKGAPGGAESSRVSKPTLLLGIITKFYYFAAVIYSVFLPLKLWTIWFYVGLPITLIGLVGSLVVLVSWAITPAGEPVTRGLYRYSRHPMYVTMFLLLLGVSIASASWVFLLFSIIGGVGAVYFIKMEEAFTLGHYGTAYREYMNRTPRWLGIPKSEKKE